MRKFNSNANESLLGGFALRTLDLIDSFKLFVMLYARNSSKVKSPAKILGTGFSDVSLEFCFSGIADHREESYVPDKVRAGRERFAITACGRKHGSNRFRANTRNVEQVGAWSIVLLVINEQSFDLSI